MYQYRIKYRTKSRDFLYHLQSFNINCIIIRESTETFREIYIIGNIIYFIYFNNIIYFILYFRAKLTVAAIRQVILFFKIRLKIS